MTCVEGGSRRVVIVGGGQAAGAALRTLRQLGYAGQVALVSDEVHLPYERPPLSKEYLWGKEHALRWIAPDAGANARCAIGRTALACDAASRTIALDDGSTLPYDVLLLATGGVPRRLSVPGSGLAGVHCLRSAADAAALRGSIARCAQQQRALLVVGGSWIGLEVAAGAREAGVEVILAEQGERLCGRTLPAAAADWLRDLHAARGVDLRLRTAAVRLDGEDGAVRSAQLSDGTQVQVGAVVAGIGISPNLSLARQLGLHVRSGIVVDRHGRTSAPHVYAAGDVAEQACPWHGAGIRIETWDNANRQGEAAARHIASLDDAGAAPDAAGHAAPPWFWSDQYGVNLQVLGAPTCGDEVLAGRSDGNGPLFVHLRDGAVVGAVGIDRARDMRRLRKLLAQRPAWRAQDLAVEGFF
ncbi:NAD(P)/FAD-dependent oxidoreductase [Xenophilus azovorans]|uniref:NAD(P)/FAD-dependent oxidoreductase n=1 Tax=Xenophilus azovorans TaxID=151755 RepID=UPI00056EDFF4|nr:FAD-dependent oxidoreductase [Xenophilus azovorans]